jgi:hypothetical protein
LERFCVFDYINPGPAAFASRFGHRQGGRRGQQEDCRPIARSRGLELGGRCRGRGLGERSGKPVRRKSNSSSRGVGLTPTTTTLANTSHNAAPVKVSVIAPGKLANVVIRESDPIRPHHRTAAPERLPPAGQRAGRGRIFRSRSGLLLCQNFVNCQCGLSSLRPPIKLNKYGPVFLHGDNHEG